MTAKFGLNNPSILWCKVYFDILNLLGADNECDRQMYGRTDRRADTTTTTTTTTTVIFSSAEFKVTHTDRRQRLLTVEAVQREVDALTCLGTYQPWTAGGAGRRTGLRPSRHQITGLGLEGKSAVQGTRVTVSADNCTQSVIFILSRLVHDVWAALKCRIS